jgi:aminopeptidase N
MRNWLIVPAAVLASGIVAFALLGMSGTGTKPAAAKAKGECVNGGASIGDTYYPYIGNTGYDVAHYDLDLGYDPSTHLLDGKATISASALESLCTFNLDLRGLTVKEVRVNDEKSGFTRDGNELVITPKHMLQAGDGFTVEVVYSGEPGPAPRDPDGFLDGWFYTSDGSYTANPPLGADTWFPNNNTTNDKATYRFTVTVPEDLQVVANGQLIDQKVHRKADGSGQATFVWEETEPMASYVSTVDIGKFDFEFSQTPAGIPIINATQPGLIDATARARLDNLGNIVDYFSTVFGPYPFASTGAIVDQVASGYQMETQTRPEFNGPNGLGALAHELVHQWYGDNVAVARMRDVWLSEGFATFGAQLWNEHNGGTTAQQSFDTNYARSSTSSFWNNTVVDPGVTNQYQNATVYSRGAMTLQALRVKVGDPTFFQILQDFTATFGGRVASTDDFISLVERDSGLNLDAFFNTWLRTPGKPTSW